MSTLLDAALGYVRLGWPLLPIRPDAKKPLTDHAVYDASTDPAVLRGPEPSPSQVVRHAIDRLYESLVDDAGGSSPRDEGSGA